MDWTQRANIIENQTDLGRRESQVFVLNRKGYNLNEISERIREVDGESPKIKTLKSIISKLKKRYMRMRMGEKVMNKSLDDVLLPHRCEFEFNRSLSTVVYIGKIAAGKTVAAKKHALQLRKNQDVEHVIVIDVLSEWKKIQNLEGVTVKDMSGRRSTEETVKELKEIADGLQDDKNYAIFIEQGHYLSDHNVDTKELYKYLRNLDANISLRLISQSYKELTEPSAIDIDVYNIFRMDTDLPEDVGIKSLGIATPRNLSGGINDPVSEAIQYNKVDDDATLNCVYITEEERKLIEI